MNNPSSCAFSKEKKNSPLVSGGMSIGFIIKILRTITTVRAALTVKSALIDPPALLSRVQVAEGPFFSVRGCTGGTEQLFE